MNRSLSQAATPTDFCYKTAFCRNRGLVSELEQQILKQSTIAIPGMGGVGGIHLATLARMGFGGFHIADADTFSLQNFNRQFGATVSTLGSSKVDVMERVLKDINPEARLKKWNAWIDESNVEAFLRGTQLVVDSLDAYALDARRLLFTTAQKMGIPVISAGPVGFSAAMLIFLPTSPSFDSYFDFQPGAPFERNFLKFILGVTPRPKFLAYMDMKAVQIGDKSGPSIASAVNLCAGFAATEALKIVLRRGRTRAVPHYHYYDAYLGAFRLGYLPFGNRNPLQRLIYRLSLGRFEKKLAEMR